jgi:hypothetical protein
VIRKSVLLALSASVLVLVLALAGGAGAAPPVCDPTETECGGGEDGPVTNDADLTVEAPTPSGNVQSDPAGINCGNGPTACRDTTYEYTVDCSENPDCDYSGVTTVTLTVTGGPPGHSADWTVCDANAGGTACLATPNARNCDTESGTQCTLAMTGNYRVSLIWRDTQDPTVSLISPAAKAGPATSFSAAASDNVGVARVEFYVDGVLRGTDNFAPYTFSPNLPLYAHGSQHSLTVRSFDVNGRSSALSPSHTFTVDRATAVAIDSPPSGGHFSSAPEFVFTKDADATAKCETMSGLTGGTVLHTDAGCADSYTPQPDGPGDYRVRITATDNVGNVATTERSFTIDPTVTNPGSENPGPTGPGPTGPDPAGRTIGRTLSISFRKGKVRGVVKPAGGCASRERVRLYRVKKGRDPVVGKDATDHRGRYAISKPAGDGHFYTKVVRSANGIDTCAAARSKTLIFATAT